MQTAWQFDAIELQAEPPSIVHESAWEFDTIELQAEPPSTALQTAWELDAIELQAKPPSTALQTASELDAIELQAKPPSTALQTASELDAIELQAAGPSPLRSCGSALRNPVQAYARTQGEMLAQTKHSGTRLPWYSMKRLIAIALVAAAAAVYLKRPVRQPQPTGSWDPAEHQRTTH